MVFVKVAVGGMMLSYCDDRNLVLKIRSVVFKKIRRRCSRFVNLGCCFCKNCVGRMVLADCYDGGVIVKIVVVVLKKIEVVSNCFVNLGC